MSTRLPRRLTIAAVVAAILVASGTLGFRLIEGPEWSWFDALYMTAITLTTVGFLEVHQLSPAGRMFTVVLCLGGVSMLAYSIGEVIRFVVTGELRRELGRSSMERLLAALDGHVVVCGYGRIGKLVCQQLALSHRKYAVVEKDLERLEELRESETPWVNGDATNDEVLKKAGVERATGLVAAVSSDAANLYIVLSARLLSPSLHIVARCEDEESADKFRRVGANHVVSPYVIGGLRISQAVVRPAVAEFIDKFSIPGEPGFQIEEIVIQPSSRLTGRSLAELRLPQELGLTLLALWEQGGGFVTSPGGETLLRPGMTMIVIGHRNQLTELERLAAGE